MLLLEIPALQSGSSSRIVQGTRTLSLILFSCLARLICPLCYYPRLPLSLANESPTFFPAMHANSKSSSSHCPNINRVSINVSFRISCASIDYRNINSSFKPSIDKSRFSFKSTAYDALLSSYFLPFIWLLRTSESRLLHFLPATSQNLIQALNALFPAP
jgi:hypothetical protein